MKCSDVLIGLVMVVLVGPANQVLGRQQTVSGCYDRSSSVLRKVANADQCKPDEIFISWSVPEDGKRSYPSIPWAGPQPPAVAEPERVTRISVYDAEDQFIGLLLDVRPSRDLRGEATQGRLTLYLSELDKFIEMADDGSSITDSFSSKPFYYDRLNCQGNAYIIDPTSFYFVHEQKDVDGSSLFVVPLWVPELPCFDFESRLSRGECEIVSAEEASSCSAVPVSEVNLPFNLPLAMPLEFKQMGSPD